MLIKQKGLLVFLALIILSFALYYILSVFDPFQKGVRYSPLIGIFYIVNSIFFANSDYKLKYKIFIIIVTIFFVLSYFLDFGRSICFL